MKSHRFREFDAFAESVGGIDATMMLANPTERIWAIDEVALPGIRVQLGQLGSGNLIEGQSWPDGYLLYLPLTDSIGYSANGRYIDNNAFAVFEPGCEFCFSTTVAHDWCTIFVPTKMLDRGGDLAVPSPSLDKPKCLVTKADRYLANRFRGFVNQIMTAAKNTSQFESSSAATIAAAEAMKIGSYVVAGRQADAPNQQGRPSIPRAGIIRCSRELLEERADRTVSVKDLAATADVSERTLRAAFQEYFGVSPVRYLHLRQLHQVYRALRAADPKATIIADILVDHGVWEFGRFATRYRRLFGELPSETLKTKG